MQCDTQARQPFEVQGCTLVLFWAHALLLGHTQGHSCALLNSLGYMYSWVLGHTKKHSSVLLDFLMYMYLLGTCRAPLCTFKHLCVWKICTIIVMCRRQCTVSSLWKVQGSICSVQCAGGSVEPCTGHCEFGLVWAHAGAELTLAKETGSGREWHLLDTPHSTLHPASSSTFFTFGNCSFCDPISVCLSLSFCLVVLCVSVWDIAIELIFQIPF